MSALDFAEYFRSVHGVLPFPWQERLVRYLIERNSWPDLIDLPTAAGKTACIDVALFYLAWCIERGEPWRAARRIVFVVDRRIVVDAAADRAERIRQALEEKTATHAVKAVAAALSKAGGDSPLVCQKLRGGMPRERSIALNPTQPMVVTSTVDQVGSRLLFRGYGVSPYSWPIHAGLLAFDTLLLLDEAHLSTPFVETIIAIQREQARSEEPIAPARPIQFVSLSATGRSDGQKFRLDSQDLEDPVIRQRRNSHKPSRLVETAGKPTERIRALLKETLAAYAELSVVQQPAIAVVVNRVRTARALFEALQAESAKHGFSVDLLTGRSRPLDRDAIAKRVVERCGAGRISQRADRGLIVVATQTIEVGADLDFQGMVSECAALDALRQRFGRLDRLGTFQRTRSAIVGGGDADDDPVYGAALNQTWRWINSVAVRIEEVPHIDFSIAAIDALLVDVDTHALATPPRSTLQLTPLYVELLSQTSPAPAYDPDIEGLLHGLDSSPRDVQIIWREDLPVVLSDEEQALDTRELSAAQELLRINPPTSLEALSLPVHAARAWLDGDKDKFSIADVEGALAEDQGADGESRSRRRQVLRWRGDRWDAVFGRELRAGDTIVVPTEYGGCDNYGFDPDNNDRARDLSSHARKGLKRSPLLVVTAKTAGKKDIQNPIAVDTIWGEMTERYRSSRLNDYFDLQLLFEALGALFLDERGGPIEEPVVDVLMNDEGDVYALVVTTRRPSAGDISDEDISSSETVPVTLGSHNAGVGQKARELGSSSSLSRKVVETLARAGELHDAGKADPRFQDMLRRGDVVTLPGELLAKGLRRVTQATPTLGERHEAYSVALVRAYPQLVESTPDPELAIYLVGSHHGRGRPMMPDPLDDGAVFTVEVDRRQLSFDGAPRLGALGSGWPALFWKLNRRYGPWGLAFLEAIMRLADWLRSAEEIQIERRK